MSDLLEMIQEALPFAVALSLALTALSGIGAKLLRVRNFPLFKVFITFLYLGFLLHGTILSRIESWRELIEWKIPDHWDFSNQLSLQDETSALHALFNVALFAPWGFLGMLYSRRLRFAIPCILSGAFMSLLIEFFQICHGMSFDCGDFAANIVGCVIGVILCVPFALIRYYLLRKAARKKRKRR